MAEAGPVGVNEGGKSTSLPKALTICLCPRVPGSTTCLAIRSASMIGMSWEARSAETVDFPVAIPPVRPTTACWKKSECWEVAEDKKENTEHPSTVD